MSYYDPFQGIPQQYIAQPYYPQYYQQQNPDDQLILQDGNMPPQGPVGGVDSRQKYEQYAQFQGNDSFFEGDSNSNNGGNIQGAPAGNNGNNQQNDFYDDSDVYANGRNQLSSGNNSSGNYGNYQTHFGKQGSNVADIYGSSNANNGSGNSSVATGLGMGGLGMTSPMHGGMNGNMNPSINMNGGQHASMNNGGMSAGMGAPKSSGAPSRTVYLGNIPSDIHPNELLDYVRSGILESVKILPAKNCAFISFIDHQSALLFHSDCILKKLSIKGHDIRIGWGKNTSILPAVMEAIQRDGATRNVYLGNLNNPVNGEVITEEELREDLSCYGVIDCIKIIPEKGIAFIHFLSILSAIRCVANLPLKEKYLDKKCFYGKDRCAFITKTQQHNAAQYLGLAPGMEHIVTAADREFISSALVQQSAAAAQIATQAGGANNLGNRTVYLGNLHQDSSVEEICNVVRGGLLQSIRFLKERHVCFITFIDPIATAQFFAMCQLHGLTIHNRRIKVGWGKHSGPLPNALSLAVSNGALRNIYIGNIVDFEYYNPNKLRDDFSKFGDIEQINYLEEKNCAFINFVNIANAIKAIDGIKSFGDYKSLKINFGKDRCGNLPRQFQNQQNNGNNNNQQNNQNQHQQNQQNQQHHEHHDHQQHHEHQQLHEHQQHHEHLHHQHLQHQLNSPGGQLVDNMSSHSFSDNEYINDHQDIEELQDIPDIHEN